MSAARDTTGTPHHPVPDCSLTVPVHIAGAPGSSADDSLQLELAAAQAAGEALRKELAASQRQTESAVNQLRDAQMRIDRLQVLAS